MEEEYQAGEDGGGDTGVMGTRNSGVGFVMLLDIQVEM